MAPSALLFAAVAAALSLDAAALPSCQCTEYRNSNNQVPPYYLTEPTICQGPTEQNGNFVPCYPLNTNQPLCNSDWTMCDNGAAATAPPTPSPVDLPLCSSGIPSDSGAVCCAAGCGKCGGCDCGTVAMPAHGADECCPKVIMENEVYCMLHDQVGCILNANAMPLPLQSRCD